MANTTRGIRFFSEDITLRLKNKAQLRDWFIATAQAEGARIKELNYIFCSDAYLLEINQSYLNHDTYTDIITFDNSEIEGRVVGDIFISIDRVRENAQSFAVSENDELHRVMIHGLLHLLGYADKSKTEKAKMTEKENYYLALRLFVA
ncbi:MAG: rRNA maturation RNase YbeY [Sphingobacteriaceae bacterium]